MIRYITGILDDGTASDSDISKYSTIAIRATQNDDIIIYLTVKTVSDVDVDLSSATSVLTVKPRQVGAAAAITATGVYEPKNERVKFTISGTSTKPSLMPAGKYVYDIHIEISSQRDTVVPASAFILTEGIGKP